ncbi:MAG: hypothetical protein ACOYON_00730 [Fimbriimonas sp.]
MITCQLTKLESAVDQVKKTLPKLLPADQALVASALTLSGRHAIALYEGGRYQWPEDIEKLVDAMAPHVRQVQEAIDATAPKKVSKNAPEEEPVFVSVGLMPNLTAGEKLLSDRDDLKSALSDLFQEGVEYIIGPNDVGWQWALERTNWSTIAGQDLSKRIKVKVHFSEGAIGTEMGNAPKKKSRATKAEAVADIEPEADIPPEVELLADAE